MGATNPCLAAEAAWAGGGLNLYIYLTYGTDASSGDPACAITASPAACNFGFDTALDAFAKAQAAGVNTSVAWWLDVEDAIPRGRPTRRPTPSWSRAPSTASTPRASTASASTPARAAGRASWATTTPAVPYWAADWGTDPAATCAERPLAVRRPAHRARSRSSSTARPVHRSPTGG